MILDIGIFLSVYPYTTYKWSYLEMGLGTLPSTEVNLFLLKQFYAEFLWWNNFTHNSLVEA